MCAGGRIRVTDYTQFVAGQLTMQGHAVTVWNPHESGFFMYCFDAGGSPPTEFKGNYEGETFVLAGSVPGGSLIRRTAISGGGPGRRNALLHVNANPEARMHFTLAPVRTATVLGLLCLVCSSQVAAQDRDLLSVEISTVLEEEGLEAAQKRFEELYPAQQDEYEPDTGGLFQIASGYMQAGDMETAQALMEMAATVAAGASTAFSESMYGDMAGIQTEAASTPSAEQAGEKTDAEPTLALDAGPSRTDLERFAGLYSDPAEPDENKSFWAAVGCDGRLVTGATWGDASPWWMRSVSDVVFEYSDSWTDVRMEFEAGPAEPASGMTHDRDDILPSPLIRIGPLPADWGGDDCIQPPEVCTTC
jgi:hypothetical protein